MTTIAAEGATPVPPVLREEALRPVTSASESPGDLDEDTRQRIRAMAAGTDNVGLFFGEDIFIAFGAVLLIQSFFKEHGLNLDPLHIAMWGIPTAICAFVIH